MDTEYVCPKCTGHLERDWATELETRSKPSYRCVNCSLRLDQRTMINRGMSVDEQSAIVDRLRKPQRRFPIAPVGM